MLIEQSHYAKVTTAAHSAQALLRVPLLGNPFVSSSSIQQARIWLYCRAFWSAGLRSLLQGFYSRNFRIFRELVFGVDGLSCGCALVGFAGCAQVAEWLMAADCKSARQ
jgi:hypothetical protein